MPSVPKICPDGFNALDVDDTDVKCRLVAGSPEGLVPLTAYLGLVMQKDCITVYLQLHGVALEIEVELR